MVREGPHGSATAGAAITAGSAITTNNSLTHYRETVSAGSKFLFRRGWAAQLS